MLIAFVVSASLTFLFVLIHPTLRKAFLQKVFCDTFDLHPWQVIHTHYAKGWTVTPFKRRVLRTRSMWCPRCWRVKTLSDSAPIFKDWQNPERLFDKKGPRYAS